MTIEAESRLESRLLEITEIDQTSSTFGIQVLVVVQYYNVLGLKSTCMNEEPPHWRSAAARKGSMCGGVSTPALRNGPYLISEHVETMIGAEGSIIVVA